MHTITLMKSKLDWFVAIFFDIALGLTVLLPSNSIRAEEGSLLAALPESTWGFVLLLIGAVRLAALIINGHWSSTKTAIIRGIASAFSAAFWVLIFYIAFEAFRASGNWYPTQTMFLAIVAADIFCCLNAGYDYGVRRKPKVVTTKAETTAEAT